MEWRTNTPKENATVIIMASDFRGEYLTTATWKPYKRPKPGECKKGFRKGCRWVDESGVALTRKELPDKWAYIEPPIKGGD